MVLHAKMIAYKSWEQNFLKQNMKSFMETSVLRKHLLKTNFVPGIKTVTQILIHSCSIFTTQLSDIAYTSILYMRKQFQKD